MQAVKWTAEGTVKGAQFRAEYSVTSGARQAPGVCLYPDERTKFS